MCCHTETQVADQTFHLIQSQYTDAGPTSPSADTITSSAWQGGHCISNVQVTGMTRPRIRSTLKRSTLKAGIEPRSAALRANALTTGPKRRSFQRHLYLSHNFSQQTSHTAISPVSTPHQNQPMCSQPVCWPACNHSNTSKTQSVLCYVWKKIIV